MRSRSWECSLRCALWLILPCGGHAQYCPGACIQAASCFGERLPSVILFRPTELRPHLYVHGIHQGDANVKVAIPLLQLLAPHTYAAWLESTGLPIVPYTVPEVEAPQNPMSRETYFLYLMEEQTAACDPITGSSGIMNLLQVHRCLTFLLCTCV